MFALLPHVTLGFAIIETQDGMHARQIGVCVSEAVGDRVVELLNRFGMTDNPTPAELQALLDPLTPTTEEP